MTHANLARPHDPSLAATPAFASPAMFAPADTPQDVGTDWRRVGLALLRFKWMVAGVTLVVTASAFAISRVIKPVYGAQATIWIDQESRRTGSTGAVGSQAFEPEGWADLLRSYVVLEPVVQEQHLNVLVSPPLDSAAISGFAVADGISKNTYRLAVGDGSPPRFVLSDVHDAVIESGAVGDSIGRKVGFRWAPAVGVLRARSRYTITVSTPRDAARDLGEVLQVHADPDGNFMKIEIDGTDPARITATLNSIGTRFVAVAGDLRRRKLKELTTILGGQAEYARKTLHDAESSLEGFRKATITLPSEREIGNGDGRAGQAGAAPTPSPAVSGYFSMRRDLDDARDEGAILQRLATAPPAGGLPVEELERLHSVQQSSEMSQLLKDLVAKRADLRALRYRYSDAYPAVQRLQDEVGTLEQQTIPALAKQLADQLASRETGLGAHVASTERELRAIPGRTTDETRLRRNVAIAENLFNGVEQKFDEVRVAEASALPDVRVLDPAVMPHRPLKNLAPRLVALALLLSLGVASTGAVLIDKADHRYRYPEQVSRETGLTILGALPHLAPRKPGGPEYDVFLEALRAIRMNLECAYGAAGPVVLTITSPGASDGKSFLSSNLARVFADGGRRTLLIDADLRRGALHRLFGAQRKPGLSDYLRGDAGIDATIRHTPIKGLDIISCGTRSKDAPELLGAQAMAQLLASVRRQYDVILCDSPPLAACVDPFVLATATGNLLLVLRTGVSDRDMTEARLDVVSRLPVRLLGAVLNDVPDGTTFGFYRYYLPGYEAIDERGAAETTEPSYA